MKIGAEVREVWFVKGKSGRGLYLIKETEDGGYNVETKMECKLIPDLSEICQSLKIDYFGGESRQNPSYVSPQV